MSEAAALPAESRLFLGRYRAVRPLGTGGSGSVWLARDERSGREVAVKVVAREGKSGSRARREAQAMARLRHPGCLRAYACGRDAENVYIAYEYVPGRTFREALRAGQVTDDVAVETAVHVLEALAHAHDHGIVHRDVKPANVLLADGDGVSARLLDFGLARFSDSETLTGAGDVPGTLAYIAPERLRGDVAGEAGDVWSVGVLLYEALSGRHPFWRSSLAESAEAITSGAPPLHAERPDLPEPLLDAVDRALALDPAKRPSAAKLARKLRSARGERTHKAHDWRPTLERRILPAFLAAVYAAGGAALLPFYPPHAVPIAAAVAGAVAALAPRWGLAFALAVPILPLGNVALGLALVYAAAAVVWLAVAAREPERGLLPAVAPLTGPLAPVVVPLALFTTRSAVRRALGAAAGIVLAEVVHAVRAGPIRLGIPGSRHPESVAVALVRAAPHALVFELPIVAAVAVLLPIAVRRRNDLAQAAARLRSRRRNTPDAESRAYTR